MSYTTTYTKEDLPGYEFSKVAPKDHTSHAHRDKQEIFRGVKVIGKVAGKFKTLVDLRLYTGRSRNSSTVTASIWVSIYEKGVAYCVNTLSGVGKSNGCGYDLGSAAAATALLNSGFMCSKNFDSAGDTATKEALAALALSFDVCDEVIVVDFHA